MEPEGMVAVVRGLRGAGLTVTLLDSGRQYTLMPDAVNQTTQQQQKMQHTHTDMKIENRTCDTGAQATDGRYASTYRTAHCHMNPTSPVMEATEFPTQRAEVCRGHGNFEVGGYGSAETYSVLRSNSYRGGMCWPDRGSVCVSRPSHQPDSFADSLRKYPNCSVSPERSSEMVERMISFTQNKNFAELVDSGPTVIIKSNLSSNGSVQHYDAPVRLKYSRNSLSDSSHHSSSHSRPQENKPRRLVEESPTRDRDESWNCRDVRCFRDMTRNVTAGVRGMAKNEKNNLKGEKTGLLDEIYNNRGSVPTPSHSVNMEIQAAVQMVSREVVTLPKLVYSQRTIAIPLSPVPSEIEQEKKIDLNDITHTICSKSTQTLIENIDKETKKSNTVQTSISFLNLNQVSLNFDVTRHIKSQDELKFGHIGKNTIIRNPKHRESMRVDVNKKRRSQTSSPNINKSNYKTKRRKNHQTEHAFHNISVKDTHLKEILQLVLVKFNKSTIKAKILQCLLERLNYDASDFEDDEYKELLKGYGIEIIHNSATKDVNMSTSFAQLDVKAVGKITSVYVEKVTKNGDRERSCLDNKSNSSFKCHIEPTKTELRYFITHELRKSNLQFKIQRRELENMREQLIQLFQIYVSNTPYINNRLLVKHVTELLHRYGFYDAVNVAKSLIDNFKKFFSTVKPTSIKSDTFIVLANTTNNLSSYNSKGNDTDFSINAITLRDIEDNLNSYTNELSNQIDEWLTSLQVPTSDQKLRRSVIYDLAKDIMNRHKYLELNPSFTSETAELEHLKYQIFKWVSKLIGDDMSPLKHASDLMRRIQSVPVPMLSLPRDSNKSLPAFQNQTAERRPGNTSLSPFKQAFETLPDKTLDNFSSKASNAGIIINELVTTNKADGKCHNKSCVSVSRNQRRPNLSRLTATTIEPKTIPSSQRYSSPVALNKEQSISGMVSQNPIMSEAMKTDTLVKGTLPRATNLSESMTIEKLNEEYDEFLKYWIQQLPMSLTGSDNSIIEKLRLGLYNGIWKAITKLKCDAETFHNRFFYEDRLDDEIENLISGLPETSELSSKKHLWKVKLIQRTADTHEVMKALLPVSSFKQQLVENVKNKLTRIETDIQGTDPVQLFEELQILNLVEDYILCSRYKEDDKTKSEAYRKKLIREVEILVDKLKTSHGKQLKDIDPNLYLNDILTALHKVPLPSEDTIRDEADEILLAIEIDQWFINLPLIENDDYIEKLKRRRLRDNLAKKIHVLDKDLNTTDAALKHEVSRVLERAPLLKGESLNINSMVDDLVNQIKRANAEKRVVFQDPCTYEQFSKDMPFSSSHTEIPGPYQSQNLPSSSKNLAVQEFTRTTPRKVANETVQEPAGYRTFDEDKPVSSSFNHTGSRWYTLHDRSVGPQGNASKYVPPHEIEKSSVHNTHVPYEGEECEDDFHSTKGSSKVDDSFMSERDKKSCCKSKSDDANCSTQCQTDACSHNIINFYKSTSQDGIKRVVERNNKTFSRPEVDLSQLQTKATNTSNLEGNRRLHNEGREVDDEVCRCVERMWKNNRRAVWEDMDFYPHYFRVPCFYPYYY